MPLDGQSVDIITSSNGLSNAEDMDQALAECAGGAKPGSQLVATWNLPESMIEVYSPARGELTFPRIVGRLGPDTAAHLG